MGNVKSIWSKKEECPKTGNGETNSSTNSTYDANISMSEKTVNGEMDSTGTDDVKTVSEEVENTEQTNGEVLRKRKRKRRRNKKLAAGEELPAQSQVNGGQQMDTNIVRSLSEKLTMGEVEIVNKKSLNFVTRSKKMLLILDVNGLLGDVIQPPPKDCKPDIKILRRAIFKRPFLDDFLEFCFDRFDVAIWSSRTRKILDPVVDYLLGDLKKKLVFLWDLSHCTNSSARSLENHHKFIVFKKLGKIWEEDDRIASENGYYDELNTLLLDDSPYKALLNPVLMVISESI